MNDDIDESIEICTRELVPVTEAVQVLVNEIIDGKDTLCAISERENCAADDKADVIHHVNGQDESGEYQKCDPETVTLTSVYVDEVQGDTLTGNETVTVVASSDALTLNSQVATGDTDKDGESADNKQFVIVTPNGTATLGVGTLELVADVDGVNGEPAVKRYRMQGEDGQSYILTVTADGQLGTTPPTDEHQYQTKQAVQEEGTERPRNAKVCDAVKRTQLLSSDVSQAWFTTRQDKNILQNSGAMWKQGQWTKDEVDLLQENISEYCRVHGVGDPTEIIFEMSKDDRKQFYRTVARGLQRPLFSVYRRVTRMYDQKNHMGKYSQEETMKLRELRLKHGSDWAAIGQALGRSGSSVKDKCRLMKDTCNSGKWLPEEEKRLTRAVYDLAGGRPGEDIVHGLSWAQVAERVGTRSEKQCRTKWLNYMNWKMKGGKEWTRMDDMNLIVRVSNLGVEDDTEIDWDALAKDWKSARSPQWLRGKWWSLKRHISDYQLISFTELLDNMKQYYLQNVRVRNAVGTARTRKLDTSGQTLEYTLMDGDTLPSIEGTTLDEIDPTVQAYEVLNTTGSYIIAGQPPDTNQPLTTSLSVVIRVPSSTDLNDAGVTSLEHADLTTTILTGTIDHTGQELGGMTEENVITQSGTLGDDTSFNTHVLEESVISSPADVSLVLKQETYVQSAGNGQLMTSFADPMLNSDSNSLMGTVSDVETDKSHTDDIIVKLE